MVDYPVMAGALGVFTGTQEEVERQEVQVGDVLDILVRG